MGLVREVLDALHVHVVDLAGWEADDILATVAEQAKAEGHEVIIVTGDRDSYQLVDDPGVKVLYNRRGVSDYALYDEAGIKEKTGVTPAQYTQYAALRGDPSDNLDGVPGVGEKTAAKLINTYGGLDGIFANVEAQTPKLRASLAEHEARVRSNAELMVLRRNAPIDVDLESLTIEPDVAEVRRLFDFLEFRALTDRLFEALGTPGAQQPSAEAQVLEAEITDLADPAVAVAAITALDSLDVVASWSGDPGRSDLVGLAVVTVGRRVRGGLDPGRRRRPSRRARRDRDTSCAARPQRQGADALGARSRCVDHRSADGRGHRRLPHRSGRCALRPGRPAAAVHAVSAALQRRLVGRPARLQRRGRRRSAYRRPRGARRRPSVVGTSGGTRQAGDGRALRNDRESAGRRAGRDGTRRHRRRHGRAAPPQPAPHVGERTTRRRAATSRRPTVQLQLAGPAPRVAVHREAVGSAEEDQDGLFHRCGDAAEAARRMAGVHRSAVAVPRDGEAARHVRHRADGRGGARRQDPRDVQPDGGAHRTVEQRSAEPAQHSGAQRRGAPVPQGVRTGPRLRVAGGRLQPDRAAMHRPSRRRPGPDRGLSQRRRHPQRDGLQGVRRRAGRCDHRDAIEGQDGQLRPGLRHGVVRPRSAIGHSHRRCCGDPRCLLRGLPQREGVHGSHGHRGPHAGLHRDACSVDVARSQSCRTPTSGSARPASARR